MPNKTEREKKLLSAYRNRLSNLLKNKDEWKIRPKEWHNISEKHFNKTQVPMDMKDPKSFTESGKKYTIIGKFRTENDAKLQRKSFDIMGFFPKRRGKLLYEKK